MRFETKFDRWLVAVSVLGAVIAGVAPALRFVAPGAHFARPWVLFLTLASCVVALRFTLPQYYEVQEGGLFLRQGWRKTLIPYASLVELQPMSSTRSASVFSINRILVATGDGKRFVIALVEEERFLNEVSKRCPRLQRRNSGLRMPFTPMSTV